MAHLHPITGALISLEGWQQPETALLLLTGNHWKDHCVPGATPGLLPLAVSPPTLDTLLGVQQINTSTTSGGSNQRQATKKGP